MTAAPAVSVVLPVYRNEDALPALHARLVAALSGVAGSWEIIFVDDHSPDDSPSILRTLATRDPRVRLIALAERGGQMAAVRAGLAAAGGRVVVTMDADLQDPPEAIPRLLAALEEGHAAVYAGRRGRYESSRRLASSWLFKHAIGLVTGMPADAGSFVAMRREVRERILALPDRSPYITAAVAWTGRNVIAVPVVRDPRPDGRSSYTTGMRLGMAARALVQALRWRMRGVGR